MRSIRAMLALSLVVAVAEGAAPAAAGEPPTDPVGVLPIGVPFLSQTCDAENEPVPDATPWPSGEPVVVPLCEADPESVAWLDWTPPAGGTAELIDAVEHPTPNVAVPGWQYVTQSGNVFSGNLEASLEDHAGVTLWVVVTDATCGELPDGPTAPCTTGSGIGGSGWVRGAVLREFTIATAHLTSDSTPCQPITADACIIGTFGDYAPPTPFTDIGSSSFDEHIAWAWQHGVTAGCALDRFCPTETVTREQMAAFLARMFDLPATDDDPFTDDEARTHEDAINRVAAAGITTGCAATLFCPSEPVRRDQMASFIARAASLPATDANPFYDDDFRTHETSISRAAAAGITTGCGAYRYCPAGLVTREQMVAFLHRIEAPATPPPAQAPCDRSYSPGLCIPPPPPDLDCGDIPHRSFAVRPPDPHGFDPDHDGIGCES
jgi:hypothetical protein